MFTCACGAAGIVTTNGGGSIVNVNVLVALFDGHAGSYAVTVTLPVWIAVGVPVIAPATVSNTTPAGSDADTICHAQRPDPPVQPSVCVYVVIWMLFVPGAMRLSPEIAFAAKPLIVTGFAPRSVPSVAAFLYALDAPRR